METGSFCISIDLERAWGIWDQPDSIYFERCARLEEDIVARLLEMFALHDISATWAVVGHLLERSDDPKRREESLWFGLKDIEKIRAATPLQDIGTHGYSHIYCGDATDAEFAEDLKRARRVHDAHGMPFGSMVFPRNHVGNLEMLKANGIKVVRGVDYGIHMTIRKVLGHWPGRIANLLDKFIPLPAAVVNPIVHPDGLVELPGSMLLLGRQGRFQKRLLLHRLYPSLRDRIMAIYRPLNLRFRCPGRNPGRSQLGSDTSPRRDSEARWCDT